MLGEVAKNLFEDEDQETRLSISLVHLEGRHAPLCLPWTLCLGYFGRVQVHCVHDSPSFAGFFRYGLASRYLSMIHPLLQYKY
jgi:hypothetical protein